MAGVFGNQGSIRAHSACSPVNPGKATYGNGVIINERKSKGLTPLRHTRHLDGERTYIVAVTTQFRRRIFSKTIGQHAFFIQRDSDLHSLSTSLFPKESNLYTICLYSIVDNVDNFPGVSGYFPTIIPEVAATLSGNKNSSP